MQAMGTVAQQPLLQPQTPENLVVSDDFSLSGDLEVAFLSTLCPGADDVTAQRTQILDSSLNQVTRAFAVSFQMNAPTAGVEFCFAEPNGLRAWIDTAGNCFAVPV